ncbi:inovirus Gp2 family protein [Shewanella intestini]|uniref:Inovirus Gp2 family protein n=1 Tax=Shewanella intestini TaxID=2017544 RepID=A0ABS5I3N1_9GAMM|nr:MULTISPECIES: inovirus Gp2 family protein [Shewanella]MBR9728294.1 inovirus Gp2 family protein [Shewanella intestini]MRG35759.1 inovirus Gp2 family protein [Shewanella sp. XMDDZSB0408]
MNPHHPTNPNLQIINNGQYQGFRVYHEPLIKQYLDATLRTMQHALNEHPRTVMIRFDLHLPVINFADSPTFYDSSVISKFFKSLDAKIKHDRAVKGREGKRVHPCSLRYVWVRECAGAATDHYHVAIFLNNDAYSHLGHYAYQGKNLSTRIVEAWASAIGIEEFSAQSLTHFPVNPMYYINKNASNFEAVIGDAFYRVSYFAKLETKHFGDGIRSFGCSQR